MYIVLELQISADGTFGNLVWPFVGLPEAESKYHTVLAAAAISSMAVHGAVIITADGQLIASQCYKRDTPPVNE